MNILIALGKKTSCMASPCIDWRNIPMLLINLSKICNSMISGVFHFEK